VGERECIKADDCNKDFRQIGHKLCSLKFANVQVLPLSRRKQGFESPRERQQNKRLMRFLKIRVQVVSKFGISADTVRQTCPARSAGSAPMQAELPPMR